MINGMLIGYKGIVDISFRNNKKDKVFLKKTFHNAGLDALFMAMCKALAGYNISDDRPIFIDLRKGPFDTNNGTSILVRRVAINGSSYSIDTDLDKWVCKFSATISYNDIISVAELSSESELRLYLINGKTTPSDLAYLTLKPAGVTTSDLDNLKSGTQALIQWKLYFDNQTYTEE